MRIPRYVPRPVLGAWMRALLSRAADSERAADELMAALLPPEHGLGHRTPFRSLRAGLAAYFVALRARTSRKTVLVPAQVCAALHHAVQRGGFEPVAVDLTPRGPTPDADSYLRHLSSKCAAVVVAPLYGHLPGDWSGLAELPRDIELVLDAAQGSAMPGVLTSLARRADAVGFSFGLGKGPDCGGGLVFSRLPFSGVWSYAPLEPLAAAAVARVAMARALALTPLYARLVDSAAEHNLVGDGDTWRLDPLSSARCYVAWRDCVSGFAQEVELARQRAAALAALARECQHLEPQRAMDLYADTHGAHLRQLVRFPTAGVSAAARSWLRAEGIDCEFAGEPLPGPVAAYPHAASFRQCTLRLPFLGRLTEREFRYLLEMLRTTIATRLPV